MVDQTVTVLNSAWPMRQLPATIATTACYIQHFDMGVHTGYMCTICRSVGGRTGIAHFPSCRLKRPYSESLRDWHSYNVTTDELSRIARFRWRQLRVWVKLRALIKRYIFGLKERFYAPFGSFSRYLRGTYQFEPGDLCSRVDAL